MVHRSLWAIAAVAALAYLLLAPSPWSVAADLLVTGATLMLLLLAVRSLPTEERRGWRVLAAGLVLFGLGDVLFDAWVPLTGQALDFPSVVDQVYVAAYLLTAVGVARLGRRDAGSRDLASALDAAILAVALGVVAWRVVAVPLWSDPLLSAGDRAWSLVYPLVYVLLLAVVLRLLFSKQSRANHAFGHAAAALTLLLLGDIAIAIILMEGGTDVVPPWLLLNNPLATALVAWAMRQHVRRTGAAAGAATAPKALGRWRLAALATAIVLAPVVATVDLRDPAHVLLVGGAGLLGVLVVLRLAQLARALHRSAERVSDLERRKVERKYRALVRNSSDVILVIDRDLEITYASPSSRRVLGGDPTGSSARELIDRLHPDSREQIGADMRRGLGGAWARDYVASCRLRSDADGYREYELVGADLLGDADVGGLVLSARDVTERAALQRQLQRLAFHDALTGLPNRLLFGDRLEHALARARRSGDTPAVVFIDIDDFKVVNDSLGHGAGDRLLVTVAERLSSELRPADTVARLGGDEFAVLLEDVGDLTEVEVLVSRLQETLRRPAEVDGRPVAVGASLGVVTADPAASPGDLLRDADIAMYAAKQQGKGTWVWFEPGMLDDAQDRMQLPEDLRRGLERGEFRLVYQPIVELGRQRIVGAEALLRWHHPDRGMVSPADFIPLAESTGQIVELGRWVLATACAQAVSWQRDFGPRYVSVNVSARQLAAPEFLVDVREVLADTGLPPSCLVLEVTETALMERPREAAVVLAELQGMGVRIAIDDFGTGYSSLGYLQRLPVDILKIDRTFVDEVERDDEGSLVSGIVQLARSLQLSTVAEGIESVEQLRLLGREGCDLGQGYLLARPLPADELELVLRAEHPLPDAA